MVISSKNNPIIKEIIKLNDKKYRNLNMLYLVEGIKTVDECILSGAEVKDIVCTEALSYKYDKAIVVTDEVFSAISSEKTPQGVIAVVKIPQTELKPPEKSCILLDRLQDPGNLGTIIRTANAAGYREIYLINCADPYSPKAVRASMSGIFFTHIYKSTKEKILSAVSGVPLICADLNGEDIFSCIPPKKFCLCIGNEGAGIDREIAQTADYKVKIPMEKTCESLNAAVSAGIAMYILKNAKLK